MNTNLNMIPKGIGIVLISILLSLLFIPSVLGAIEKNDPNSGLTVFFYYNERPIDSGSTEWVSTPYGNLAGTGQTIICDDNLKLYKGQSFAFCNINIRFFDGYTIVGDYQYSEKCYGGWSGKFSDTCVIPTGAVGYKSATQWTAYAVSIFSPSNFIIDGNIQYENGDRINDRTVELWRVDALGQEQLVSILVTKNVNGIDGIFSFTVPENLKTEKFFFEIPNRGNYILEIEETGFPFAITQFQNSYTVKLKLLTNSCIGNIQFDGIRTLCCDSNNKVIEPIYDDNTKYNIGDSCPDINPSKTDWSKYLPFILIGAGLLLWKRK